MIEISQGIFVKDVKVFFEVYEARKDSHPILSTGVKERMDLYLKAIENDKNTKK